MTIELNLQASGIPESIEQFQLAIDAAFAAGKTIGAAEARQKPDMFWNHDDAEKLYHGIGEFLNDEICNGSLEVGDIREVQQAKQLPTIKIRITSINEDECDADWEEIK